MRDFNYIYLNYACFTLYDGREVLAKVIEGNFASSAWIGGDELFDRISGRPMNIINGYDCGQYMIHRNSVRRVKDIEEFNILLNKSCRLFKCLVDIDFKGYTVFTDIKAYNHYKQAKKEANENNDAYFFYRTISIELKDSKYIGYISEGYLFGSRSVWEIYRIDLFKVYTIGDIVYYLLSNTDWTRFIQQYEVSSVINDLINPDKECWTKYL